MDQFIHLICEMAPYLLLGFFLAGLMHAFIPNKYYSKYLAKNNFKSVINAALFGIPLPLCSCGVIPTAMSLRKEGTSKGAVVSFLISTPQTGIDSIIATYGLLGLPFAIIRPIAALTTALFGGALVLTGKESHLETSHSTQQVEQSTKTFFQKIKEALNYGFIEMMEDIGKWLIIGLIVAALITICIPTEYFTIFQANTWASMLLVLCIAIPMYVCATGSIPIAVALMLKGLTPGAALVLLMAGPACNLASMLVVRKVLGTRTLIIYLTAIIIGAICFGMLVDYLHFNNILNILGQISATNACCMENTSLIALLSTVLLALLLINALIIQPLFHKKTSTQQINTSNMKIYYIEGMNCNHCCMSAQKAILAVPGVTHATVNLQTKEAYVEGDAESAAICKAIEEVGFKCTL